LHQEKNLKMEMEREKTLKLNWRNPKWRSKEEEEENGVAQTIQLASHIEPCARIGGWCKHGIIRMAVANFKKKLS